MPKRCPKCKTLNSSSAQRCANEVCDYVWSEASAMAPAPTPPVIPTPAPPPPPVADLQKQAAQHDREVAEVRALVDRLEKELVDRHTELAAGQQELDRLKQLLEQQPPGGGTPLISATTPEWMAKSLAVVAAWPRVASLVTAVMALGAGYGGVASYRGLVTPPPSQEVGQAGTGREGGSNAPDVEAQKQREAQLGAQATALTKRETDLVAKEKNLKAHETELADKDTKLAARVESVKTLERSLKPTEVRMGSFDFELPKGDGPLMLTRENLRRGVWPSRDCTVVAVTPLDRDEVPSTFAPLCRKDRIVLDRPKGAKRTVRVVWELTASQP
jgi:hypothetical protein